MSTPAGRLIAAGVGPLDAEKIEKILRAGDYLDLEDVYAAIRIGPQFDAFAVDDARLGWYSRQSIGREYLRLLDAIPDPGLPDDSGRLDRQALDDLSGEARTRVIARAYAEATDLYERRTGKQAPLFSGKSLALAGDGILLRFGLMCEGRGADELVRLTMDLLNPADGFYIPQDANIEAAPISPPTKAADFPIPPGYRYNPVAGKYIDDAGKFVAFSAIYGLLDLAEAETGDLLNNLAFALADRAIEPTEWYLASIQELQRLHVQSAALAAGGFASIKAKTFARIDKMLRDDAERLKNFGADIMSGRSTGGQISNRVNMYMGNARTQFWAAQPKPKTKRGEIAIERRIVNPEAEHCDFCVYLEGLGWQPWGSLPYPGESDPDFDGSQCLTNCRCRKESAVIKRSEIGEYMGQSIPVTQNLSV